MIIMPLPFAGQMWIRPIAKGLSSLQSGRWGSPCLGLKQLPKLSKPAAIFTCSGKWEACFVGNLWQKRKKSLKDNKGGQNTGATLLLDGRHYPERWPRRTKVEGWEKENIYERKEPGSMTKTPTDGWVMRKIIISRKRGKATRGTSRLWQKHEEDNFLWNWWKKGRGKALHHEWKESFCAKKDEKKVVQGRMHELWVLTFSSKKSWASLFQNLDGEEIYCQG